MYQNEFPSREELARMLAELSECALQYVRLPILCAYYYTDQKDPNRLTADDSLRYSLIGAAANDPENVVRLTCMMNNSFLQHEDKICIPQKGATTPAGAL